MFMELNRVKEDLHHIRAKTGIAQNSAGNNNNNELGANLGKVLGGNIA
jgi:hypothetical protein